jgi:hypothetical protein
VTSRRRQGIQETKSGVQSMLSYSLAMKFGHSSKEKHFDISKMLVIQWKALSEEINNEYIERT